MRCRRIVLDSTRPTVVWFGSTGVDENGKAKFFNDSDKHDNFSMYQQSVIDSLNQRLRILKGELWYKMTYGLPLLEKTKSKLSVDASIIETISQHADVVSIQSFTSSIVDKKYTCKIEILSKYGQISLKL